MCRIENCDRPTKVVIHDLCGPHYYRFLRHGDPLKGHKTFAGEPFEWLTNRLNEFNLNPIDECINWIYGRDAGGYGGVTVSKKYGYVHRYVCEVYHGKSPPRKNYVLHLCGKGHEGCFNPRHLKWGSQLENAKHLQTHGTRRRGDECASSKIKEKDIPYIRKAIETEEKTQSELAREFGVTSGAISAIYRRKSWNWIE